MIAGRGLALPDRHELRAAGLAGLGEASVLLLPLHAVLERTADLGIGPATLAAPFVAAYAGGVLMTCLFRTSRSLPPVAAGAALLAGVSLGGWDPGRTAVAALVCLVLAVRVVALGLRDWRLPIGFEIGFGAAALGIETIVAAGGQPGWRALLLVLVPVFFFASLTSRVTTVWTAGSAANLDQQVRSAWIRRAILTAGGLLAAMVVAVILGLRGGLLDRVGSWLAPVWRVIAAAIVFAVAQVTRPLFWLVERIGFDPEAIREFLAGLRDPGPGAEDELARSGPSFWERFLALVVLAAACVVLYRILRRIRAHPTVSERRAPPSEAAHAVPLPEESTPPPRRLLRRELPSDAVRRWYAEALLAHRIRDLRKEPALTPGEFATDSAAAFPDCAEDFADLTRAYEDVRYGRRRLDRDRMKRLEGGQRRLLAALRAAGRRPVTPPG